MRGLILVFAVALAACGEKTPPAAPSPDMAGMDMSAPAPAVSATGVQFGDFTISDAWAPVTPAGGRVAAGYLTIKNNGQSEDTLTGFSSPRAKAVELHEMLEENGMMKMQEKSQLLLRPGEEVALAPGGLHLMLIEPQLPFVDGQELPLTLTFAHAGKAEIKLLVRPRLPANAAPHAGH
ncbi:MAG: copper chaperone PCu(A)C [Caulobacterales bacterium]